MTGNGYIEIEIGGKKVGLKFTMYAVEQIGKLKGREDSVVRYYTGLIYGGALGNAYAKQIEPQISFEDANDFAEQQLLNGDEGDILKNISEVFTQSNYFQSILKKQNGAADDEAKKKLMAV